MGSETLTSTSYLVLGLVGWLQPATPYDLKQAVADTVGNFWPFPHTQLYSEPARLTELRLLAEERERSGRRRRSYRLTESGQEALGKWLSEPTEQPSEYRDIGLLKLFFSGLGEKAAVAKLAQQQIQAHEQRLQFFKEIQAAAFSGEPKWTERCGEESLSSDEASKAARLRTLAMGFELEEAALRFWHSVAQDETLSA